MAQAGLLQAAAACTGDVVSDALASIMPPLLGHPPPLPSAGATRHWRKTAAAEVRKRRHDSDHAKDLPASASSVHRAAGWLAQLQKLTCVLAALPEVLHKHPSMPKQSADNELAGQVVNLLSRLCAAGCVSSRDLEVMQTRLDGSWPMQDAQPDVSSPVFVLWHTMHTVCPILVTHTRIVVSLGPCVHEQSFMQHLTAENLAWTDSARRHLLPPLHSPCTVLDCLGLKASWRR